MPLQLGEMLVKVGYTLGIKLDDPRIIPTSEEELSEYPHPWADL